MPRPLHPPTLCCTGADPHRAALRPARQRGHHLCGAGHGGHGRLPAAVHHLSRESRQLSSAVRRNRQQPPHAVGGHGRCPAALHHLIASSCARLPMLPALVAVPASLRCCCCCPPFDLCWSPGPLPAARCACRRPPSSPPASAAGAALSPLLFFSRHGSSTTPFGQPSSLPAICTSTTPLACFPCLPLHAPPFHC